MFVKSAVTVIGHHMYTINIPEIFWCLRFSEFDSKKTKKSKL